MGAIAEIFQIMPNTDQTNFKCAFVVGLLGIVAMLAMCSLSLEDFMHRFTTLATVLVGMYLFGVVVMKIAMQEENRLHESVIMFRNEVIQLWSDKPNAFQGCTHDELQALMLRQQVSHLPSLYRDLLLKLGKGADGLKTEVAFFYHDLLDLKARAQESAKRNDWQLGEDIFVFLRWGRHFFVFPTDDAGEDDDPPVFVFSDREYLSLVCQHLSEIIDPIRNLTT